MHQMDIIDLTSQTTVLIIAVVIIVLWINAVITIVSLSNRKYSSGNNVEISNEFAKRLLPGENVVSALSGSSNLLGIALPAWYLTNQRIVRVLQSKNGIKNLQTLDTKKSPIKVNNGTVFTRIIKNVSLAMLLMSGAAYALGLYGVITETDISWLIIGLIAMPIAIFAFFMWDAYVIENKENKRQGILAIQRRLCGDVINSFQI
jgi:hypothetical protein